MTRTQPLAIHRAARRARRRPVVHAWLARLLGTNGPSQPPPAAPILEVGARGGDAVATRRGRHRVARQRRPITPVALVLAAVMVALVSSAAPVQAEAPAIGRQVDTLRTYDYNDARQWQPAMRELCIQNEAPGFPVLAAVAEFSAYVPMTVRDDCGGAAHVVYVQLVNDPDWYNSAWFDSKRDEDNYVTAGRIRLNVAQAYRLSPDGWRSILIHELGHPLGLGHPHGSAHSIMDPIDYADHTGLTELDHEQLAEIYGE